MGYKPNLPDLTAQTTAAGAVVLGSSNASLPLAVTGAHYVGAAQAGTILLIDGTSGGTQRAKINTAANGYGFIPFKNGVAFTSGVYVELANVSAVTLVYQSG